MTSVLAGTEGADNSATFPPFWGWEEGDWSPEQSLKTCNWWGTGRRALLAEETRTQGPGRARRDPGLAGAGAGWLRSWSPARTGPRDERDSCLAWLRSSSSGCD